MKKLISLVLTAILAIGTVNMAYGLELTDIKIYTDKIQNTFEGRSEAKNMINNLNFTDIPQTHWAAPSIVKAGALDMIKGYERKFNPNGTVSNQEAIAFVVRVMGLENEAQSEAINYENVAPNTGSVRSVWSIGYLSIARNEGLITNADFFDAIQEDQSTLEPDRFFRGKAATREQVAKWLVQGINYLSPELLTPTTSQQAMYKFSDWDKVSAECAQALELLVANNIMNGSNGKINPKGSLTRAEMSQILANLDSIYYTAAGIQKKTGTIGGIKDTQLTQTGDANLYRQFYVRDKDGKIDVLQYHIQQSSSPQSVDKDTVVYKNGEVKGMEALSEGDQIEYLVKTNQDSQEKYLVYIYVTNGMVKSEANGKIISVDFPKKQIKIVDNYEKEFIYSIADGLCYNDGEKNYLQMETKKIAENDIPTGATVKLQLVNNVVSEIIYVGGMNLVPEVRGFVVENNTDYGYITVIDNEGKLVTKNYYSGQLTVEKQQYYDVDDEVGYYDQIFKNFTYDPRDTDITGIEPGDIVFMQTSASDSSVIDKISASTNYTMKYGKIMQFNLDAVNQNSFQMLLQYEDGQTAWFDVADNIFISKAGKPIDTIDVQPGDWTKVLVNQAIISPGYVMESVKEMTIEGSGHEITGIIRGTLGAINNLQNEISINSVYTLTKSGWTDYQDVKNLSIANNDIQYYYEGTQVSLDYLMRYLKHAENEVYVALENNYAGETVAMVSFRSGRDDILNSDTIVNADGLGSFNILSQGGNISTDSGTIVRRHGRLVPGGSIMAADYARVVLNGNNKAAVVDIYDQPDVSGVMIARGRILSVDEGKSFTVKSTSILSGNEWVYTPVERVFNINGSTMFMNAEGITNMNSFIDYSTESVEDKVYNIVVNGTTATNVIDSPYSKYIVKGEIYSAADGTLSIKDSEYYTESTGRWNDVSSRDSSVTVSLPTNSIIVKNNKVVGSNELEKGDKATVYTTKFTNIEGGMNITGYIVLIEG